MRSTAISLLTITTTNVIFLFRFCHSPGTESPVSDFIFNHDFSQTNVEKLEHKVYWISVYQLRLHPVMWYDRFHTHRYTHAAHYKLLQAGFLKLLIHHSYISPHTDASRCILLPSLCHDMRMSACSFVRPSWIEEAWQRIGWRICEENREGKKSDSGRKKKERWARETEWRGGTDML